MTYKTSFFLGALSLLGTVLYFSVGGEELPASEPNSIEITSDLNHSDLIENAPMEPSAQIALNEKAQPVEQIVEELAINDIEQEILGIENTIEKNDLIAKANSQSLSKLELETLRTLLRTRDKLFAKKIEFLLREI